jgi:hypothetical protein
VAIDRYTYLSFIIQSVMGKWSNGWGLGQCGVSCREQKVMNYFSDFTTFPAEKRSYSHDRSFSQAPLPVRSLTHHTVGESTFRLEPNIVLPIFRQVQS